MNELARVFTIGARYTFQIGGEEYGNDTLTGTLVKQEYVNEDGTPTMNSQFRKLTFDNPVSKNDNYKLADEPFEYRNYDMVRRQDGSLKAQATSFHVSNSRGIDYPVFSPPQTVQLVGGRSRRRRRLKRSRRRRTRR